MKKDLKKILAALRSLKPYLSKTYKVKEIEVFGSYIRKEQRKNSDLDLLVELESGRSLLDLGGLWMELNERLGIRVDVVTEHGLRDRIRDRVLGEARPL